MKKSSNSFLIRSVSRDIKRIPDENDQDYAIRCIGAYKYHLESHDNPNIKRIYRPIQDVFEHIYQNFMTNESNVYDFLCIANNEQDYKQVNQDSNIHLSLFIIFLVNNEKADLYINPNNQPSRDIKILGN